MRFGLRSSPAFGAYDPDMEDVTIGVGSLAGKGVYAARQFVPGEVVVTFELRPLTRDEFDELPAGEELFVHSYGGRRWLYPPPARWVNHSDEPTCYEDFERCCDIALRRIEVGEAITIDASQETDRELSTFLDAYFAAQLDADRDCLLRLLSADAVIWDHGRSARGAEEAASMLAGTPAQGIGEVEWHMGTGRWEALCSVQLVSDDKQIHTSLFLRVLAGNWQVVYEHRG
jgi:hypothetical protein